MNIKKLFQYKPENNYNFSLTSTKSDNNDSEENDKNVYPSIDLNLKRSEEHTSELQSQR